MKSSTHDILPGSLFVYNQEWLSRLSSNEAVTPSRPIVDEPNDVYWAPLSDYHQFMSRHTEKLNVSKSWQVNNWVDLSGSLVLGSKVYTRQQITIYHVFALAHVGPVVIVCSSKRIPLHFQFIPPHQNLV